MKFIYLNLLNIEHLKILYFQAIIAERNLIILILIHYFNSLFYSLFIMQTLNDQYCCTIFDIAQYYLSCLKAIIQLPNCLL